MAENDQQYAPAQTEGEFTQADAEDAGWRIVHTADASAETANAEIWRAEKYVNTPGRAGAFVDVQATTEDKLFEVIRQREQQFSVSEEGSVLLPADGVDAEDVDASDADTVRRADDSELTAARDNDFLIVPSDPEDPESDPVRKVTRGGQEVDPEALQEAEEPHTATLADVEAGRQAAIEDAKQTRDNADSAEEADGADAQGSAAQADATAQQDAHDNPETAGASGVGSPGNSGNDPELVQPAAGEATDASDSEQQSQVPDAEAASSDAVSTNSTDEFPKTNESQPEVTGPDTDAQAPAAAPNAQEDSTAAVKLGLDETGNDAAA